MSVMEGQRRLIGPLALCYYYSKEDERTEITILSLCQLQSQLEEGTWIVPVQDWRYAILHSLCCIRFENEDEERGETFIGCHERGVSAVVSLFFLS